MKRKDIELLKSAPVGELEKKLKETQDRLRVVKFEYQAGKQQNAKEVKDLKRVIARIMTFLKQKEANA